AANGLAPFAQAVAEEVLEVRNGVDFLDRRLDIVLDAAVADGVAVEDHVARSPIAVTRLTDGPDVAQSLVAVELEGVVNVFRAVELKVLGEYARDVSVALEAILVHKREDSLHLPLVVDVFGEDVLVERVAGRSVDEEEIALPELPRA